MSLPPPPVIRIRAELNEYVNEQAQLRGVSPSDFVNGALDAFRFLKPEVRVGLTEQTSASLMAIKGQGKWVAFLVVPPGQGAQWVAGTVGDVAATSVCLHIPYNFSTRIYELPRNWIESFHILGDQPRLDLQKLIGQMQPWGIGVHYLTADFLK